ncbi:MAG: LysR family transcriptional regulator [Rhodobacteraceae bacterium]|uniref:LysR family transcriptional regulator n=1 Tax=Celeribacter sp. HF31 TaxID=2721558 RepID=UPI001431F578|nr:LysR family transcriptional regulator [Celeribacter sp. HF31]NIY79349.1 LysR family transcriptional regulator [Celeribacter sp. HF31]NVK45711.1 LysR family transcriptional regulator [Paracoccaceae bacterium]
MPTLAALRAFEVAARLGSFSAAARALNVTHAAISQHVRSLETHLDEKLFTRSARGMILTQAGLALSETLTEGFGMIVSGVRAITDERAHRPVNISTSPTFAEVWLMPKLGAFWTEHPDIYLQVQPYMGLSNLRADGIDVAIRFGAGQWPGLDVVPLLMSPFTVVCSPDYTEANSLEDIEDLSALYWVFSEFSSEQYAWGNRIGIDFKQQGYKELASNALTLSAVRSGLGVSIQSRVLVEDDIASGRMKVLYEGDPEGIGYYIVTLPGVLSPQVKTLRNWLLRNAEDVTTVEEIETEISEETQLP